MNIWVILVRREFWENRSLWIAPLATAGFLLTAMVLALLGAPQIHVNNDGAGVMAGALESSVRDVAGLMLMVAFTAVGSYLLDCLYAERRDRSILFWKSLPVSDLQTVAAKFAVAMLVVPLGVYVAALATHLLGSILLLLFGNRLPFLTADWNLTGWLVAEGNLLVELLVTLLWYAPVAAYLMLASVYARRAPMLTAVLPPLVVAIAEGLVLGSSQSMQFILRRLTPILEVRSALVSPQLWLGLVVAALLLAGVVRLRRYRDDT